MNGHSLDINKIKFHNGKIGQTCTNFIHEPRRINGIIPCRGSTTKETSEDQAISLIIRYSLEKSHSTWYQLSLWTNWYPQAATTIIQQFNFPAEHWAELIEFKLNMLATWYSDCKRSIDSSWPLQSIRSKLKVAFLLSLSFGAVEK